MMVFGLTSEVEFIHILQKHPNAHMSIPTCIVTHTAELATTREHPEGKGKLDTVKKNSGCSSQGNTAGSWQGFQLMGAFAKQSREGEDMKRRKTTISQAVEIS